MKSLVPIQLTEIRRRLSECRDTGMDLDQTINYFDSDMSVTPSEFSKDELTTEDYKKIMNGEGLKGAPGAIDLGI
ncbi:hypothetical protein ACUNWD_09985 [Sunxiuqinia sp. A32]|uniref:hypothetical protein n=1 Tax=Sunxiuqinia sp. A32 TaxID=3461496 RepID=UPI0040454CA8